MEHLTGCSYLAQFVQSVDSNWREFNMISLSRRSLIAVASKGGLFLQFKSLGNDFILSAATRTQGARMSSQALLDSFASTDGSFEKDRIPKGPGDGNTRDFTYFVLGGSRVIYASAVRAALVRVRFSQLTTFCLLTLCEYSLLRK